MVAAKNTTSSLDARSGRRRFTPLERAVIFDVACGVCALCRGPLGDDWEVDHKHPFASGGETDVINAQATCRTCNRRKGGSVSTKREPRGWHEKALREYVTLGEPQDFLVVATPGAGKTDFALQWIQWLKAHRTVVRAVIVCPTIYLCDQWREAASLHYWMELEVYDNRETPEAQDQDGMVCTYQQINRDWALRHRMFCGNRPTAVVFDEIHHAGENKAWGDGLREAFTPAAKRLALSGTAWRPDNNPIPFVRYDDDTHTSRADVTYGYDKAMRDGYCRTVFFPSFDGRVEWWSLKAGSAIATFKDELSERDARRRLQTALNPDSEWIASVVKEADAQLRELREEDPSAGGLMIASDQKSAAAYARVLQRQTGEQPALAISDSDDPKGTIERYRASTARWIVAVKMISEGVDIPRLRVCVYATTQRTELAFRQAVGRVLRGNNTAYFFIPAETELVRLAKEMADEREHQLDLDLAEALEFSERQMSETPDFFTPVSASSAQPDAVIYAQDSYSQTELEYARMLQRRAGVCIDPVVVARVVREVRADTPGVSAPTQLTPVVQAPLQVQKATLGAACDRAANRLAFLVGLEPKQVQMLLITATDKKKSDRTLEDLTWCLQLLGRWLNERVTGRPYPEWLEVARRARYAA